VGTHGFHVPALLPPAPPVSNPNLYHLNPNSSFPHRFILRSFWLRGRPPWPSLLASPPRGQVFGFRRWSLACIVSSKVGRHHPCQTSRHIHSFGLSLVLVQSDCIFHAHTFVLFCLLVYLMVAQEFASTIVSGYSCRVSYSI
jgi:hypothetical protein